MRYYNIQETTKKIRPIGQIDCWERVADDVTDTHSVVGNKPQVASKSKDKAFLNASGALHSSWIFLFTFSKNW